MATDLIGCRGGKQPQKQPPPYLMGSMGAQETRWPTSPSDRHLLPSIPHPGPTWNYFDKPLSQCRPPPSQCHCDFRTFFRWSITFCCPEKWAQSVIFWRRILIKCCHLQRGDNYKDPWWHAVWAGCMGQKEERWLLSLYHLNKIGVCAVLCSEPWRSEYKKEDYILRSQVD